MRVPLSWLRDYVTVELPPADLAHRLTMAGVEVGAIDQVGAAWRRVVVGRIDELGPHPRSPALSLAGVDLGQGTATLVTGATNLKVGDHVPVVLVGGALASGEIDSRTFSGINSEGMLCSAAELGVGDDKSGILVLGPDAPLGAELASYLGDVVFDLEVTPNRPDLLAVVGVAREVAALTGAAFHPPLTAPPAGPRPAAELVSVSIEAPDLCPRYSATALEGVRIGPSPFWLQHRLYLSGQRPISNVVDVSNYVMLELGQPLHTFDADKLRGGLVIRRARAGETLLTLDGGERALEPDLLVIADAERAVAVAGVMGGANTEVSATTTRVVIESAHFAPRAIRRAARSLRLATEAARRFERGVDPEGTVRAAERATALLLDVAGGQSLAGQVDVYPGREPPRVVRTTPAAIGGLLGAPFDSHAIAHTLNTLGFKVVVERKPPTVAPPDETLHVTVPSFRRDIEAMPDLAEEVARIRGYDTLPSRLPKGALPPPLPDPARQRGATAKAVLVACGYQEVITYSLVDAQQLSRLDAARTLDGETGAPADPEMIQLFNYMSVDRSYLRTTLLGSLLATLAANLRHRQRAFLFELAAVYQPPLNPLPTEVRRLSLVGTGSRAPSARSGASPPADFFDLKGTIETLLHALRIEPLAFEPSGHPTLHPGRSAIVRAGDRGTPLGMLGQVHPLVAERFELDDRPVYAAELDFEALVRLAGEQPPMRPIPRLPGVGIDLAVVVDEAVPERAVAAAIQQAGAPLLAAIALFDVYQGPPVPAGQRSLAYALLYRAPDRTLTDAEAEEAQAAIERALQQQFGATIRGR